MSQLGLFMGVIENQHEKNKAALKLLIDKNKAALTQLEYGEAFGSYESKEALKRTIEQETEELQKEYDRLYSKVKPINWKRYFAYHLKWQAGFIICAPLMYLFLDYLKFPYWLAMISFNFIGAIVFWPIDNYIFKIKKTPKSDNSN